MTRDQQVIEIMKRNQQLREQLYDHADRYWYLKDDIDVQIREDIPSLLDAVTEIGSKIVGMEQTTETLNSEIARLLSDMTKLSRGNSRLVQENAGLSAALGLMEGVKEHAKCDICESVKILSLAKERDYWREQYEIQKKIIEAGE